MREWDAMVYGKFERERIQPSIDLVSRIAIENPKKIIDVGCGSGMSTKVLVGRWPEAEIIGVDNSNTMLEQGKSLGLNVEWVFKDCNESVESLGMADLILSNASLQWLKNHEQVIANWFKILNPGGVIAVQIPLFEQMDMKKCIEEVVTKAKWQHYFTGLASKNCYNYDEDTYYNIVMKYSKNIDMWMTEYFNILEEQEAIVEFFNSTALRPYYSELNDAKLEAEFKEEILERIKHYYKRQSDGKVILKFKRLFIVATK